MSIIINTKPSSIARNFLVCLTVLFYLTGCESGESNEFPEYQYTLGPASPEAVLNSDVAIMDVGGSTAVNVSPAATGSTTSGATTASTTSTTSGATTASTTSTTSTTSGASGASTTAPAPTVSISVSPSNVAYGESTQLSWVSSNADSCTASGDWFGARSISGTSNVSNLTTGKNYTITCSGDGGNASDSASVTVAAPPVPAPTLSFGASLGTVSQNGSTTISWITTDVTSCTATGDWSGSKAASGSETIASIATDSQFTLTCSGAGGTVNDTINIAVVQSNNGTALLTWVPPTENTDDSALTDLVGYKIYYGTSSGSYNDTITINNPGLTSYLVEDLASADWYFVMTSVNSSGIESSYSVEVSKSIN